MTNLLIDTHIFLWLHFSPEKIAPKILQHLQDTRNQVWVSVISFWEISLKYQLGKLELVGVLPQDLLQTASQMNIQTAPISPEEFASFFRLPLVEGHKDPFDRLIIWQCITQNKVLVSHDTKFHDYSEVGLKVLRPA